MTLLERWNRIPPYVPLFLWLAAFGLTPAAAAVAVRDLDGLTIGAFAAMILAAAWLLAQRLDRRRARERRERERVRQELAATSASLRAAVEDRRQAAGRIAEIGERTRVAALNAQLIAAKAGDAGGRFAEMVHELEIIANDAETIGRDLTAEQTPAPAKRLGEAPPAKVASRDLARLAEELQTIVSSLHKDVTQRAAKPIAKPSAKPSAEAASRS